MAILSTGRVVEERVMTTRKIAIDVPESVLLAEKTDELVRP